MSKKLFQDIIPNKIGNKPKYKSLESKKPNPIPSALDEDRFFRLNVYAKKGRNDNNYALWTVAFATFIFLLFAVSTLFTRATVTITPKSKDVNLNQNFSSVKDAVDSGVLPFSVLSFKGEEIKKVIPTEMKEFSRQAKGRVVIYNTSTSSQKLSKDTRLIGTNNKVYKTEVAVTVPGMIKADIKKNIKETLPGSVEVSIYADQPGESYNSSPIDFKVVGFKGTPKYSNFYALSKGDILGGLKGRYNIVSDDSQKAVESELSEMLKSKLESKIDQEIPEGYILFKNAKVFKAESPKEDALSKEKEVYIKVRGTLYGFLFEEKTLIEELIKYHAYGTMPDEVSVFGLKDLVFNTSIQDNIESFLNINNIDFSLSGPIKFIWKVNESKVRDAIVASPKKDFNKNLSSFKNIKSASIKLKPFWRLNLPNKSENIKIITSN